MATGRRLSTFRLANLPAHSGAFCIPDVSRAGVVSLFPWSLTCCHQVMLRSTGSCRRRTLHLKAALCKRPLNFFPRADRQADPARYLAGVDARGRRGERGAWLKITSRSLPRRCRRRRSRPCLGLRLYRGLRQFPHCYRFGLRRHRSRLVHKECSLRGLSRSTD